MFAQNIQYFSLPQNIRKDLTASEFNIIYLLFDLCHFRAKSSPTGSAYAWPSQEYIASKVNRSREWVSKSISSLAEKGLVLVTHRRKVKGVWQTNLYRVGAVLWASIKKLTHCISSLLHHVNSGSHIVLKPSLLRSNNNENKDFSHNNKSPGLGEIINRMTQKMGYAE